MSLENNIKRIADSLEQLVKTVQQTVNPVITVAAPAPAPSTQSESKSEATPPQGAAEAINTTAPAPAPAPVAPAPAPAPAPVAPAPAPAPAPVSVATPMTPQELNAALVKEFNRLGDRAPIDNALREMGVTGVTELPAERYQELLSKVQAISNG